VKQVLLALVLLFSTAAFAKEAPVPVLYKQVAAAPTDPHEAEIAALFDHWNATLATGDADKMAALYAPNGVLEPALSNQVRATAAAIKEYFVKFLKNKPKAAINYREIRLLDDTTALDAGVYTFTLTKDGKMQKVKARYTYVYEKINGEWKIMDHHSSLMPE